MYQPFETGRNYSRENLTQHAYSSYIFGVKFCFEVFKKTFNTYKKYSEPRSVTNWDKFSGYFCFFPQPYLLKHTQKTQPSIVFKDLLLEVYMVNKDIFVKINRFLKFKHCFWERTNNLFCLLTGSQTRIYPMALKLPELNYTALIFNELV